MDEFEGQGTVDLPLVPQFFDTAVPFNVFLGLKILEIKRGIVTAKLPYRPELVGDSTRGALHGGVISMMADTVGGAAVFTLTDPGDRVATIDLRVDYLRPGRQEDLHAHGRVVRVGNRVGVSSIEVFHPSAPETPIAVSKGVYTIKRAKDRSPSEGA
jgi:uncharacterized protein (TIGR00369 family)